MRPFASTSCVGRLAEKALGMEPEAQTKSLAASLQSRERSGHRQAALAADPGCPPQIFQELARRHDQPSIAVMPFDNLSGDRRRVFRGRRGGGDHRGAVSRSRLLRHRAAVGVHLQGPLRGRARGRARARRQLCGRRHGAPRRRPAAHLRAARGRGDAQPALVGALRGRHRGYFRVPGRIAAQVAGAIHPAVRNAEIEVAKADRRAACAPTTSCCRPIPKIWGRSSGYNATGDRLLRKRSPLSGLRPRARAAGVVPRLKCRVPMGGATRP